MSQLIDIIRRVVLQELARNRTCLLGVVTAVYAHEDADDRNNYETDVRLKHEDLVLTKVPMAVSHVGFAAPPRIGDLALVQFVDGDLNQPVIAGRFYHADERPPLHQENEMLFEQRCADGKLNHLRFAADGSIILQRDVTKPEDNSEAQATIQITPAGDIEIKTKEKVVLKLTNENRLEITADGLPIHIKCDKLTLDGNMDVNGDVKVSGGGHSTTISGNEIIGS